jgi:RNA polymerase-binding transcription factor DksA
MDYLMSKYNEPIKHYSNAARDRYIIARHAPRMQANTSKHITAVISNIKSYMASANLNHKKYQIQGYHAYKKISSELTASNIKHELITGDLQMSELELIVGGQYFCCYDCDTPISYYNKHVPVMYIKIIK